MSLKLNLGDIDVTFRISGYHKPRNEDWDDEWCKVSLSLQAGDWLNYNIVDDEILLCCEVDSIVENLTALKEYKMSEIKRSHFIEPDLEFEYRPQKRMRYSVSWIINFWNKDKALTANYLNLTLDSLDIANLLNYLRHIQSENEEEYIPVTGDGLTEKQLYEELQKSEEDIKAGRVYSAEEVFEKLRKEIYEKDDLE